MSRRLTQIRGRVKSHCRSVNEIADPARCVSDGRMRTVLGANVKRHMERSRVRYYGANATRHLKAARPSFPDAIAEIESKQAIYALTQLHAELAGKLLENHRRRPAKDRHDASRGRTANASAGFNVAGIAAKRRNKSNPWFKRGTLFRSAVDVLRRASSPMTPREIAQAMIADKAVPATRKQFMDLVAAINAALRKRDGVTVVTRARPQGGG
jgi:hypothetical protein